MKRPILVGLALASCVAAALAAVSVYQITREQIYTVRGRVAGFGLDDATIMIEHEEIPGYMPAMTMGFTVQDTGAISALNLGDAVQFAYHTTADSFWISHLETVPDSAVAVHPARGTLDLKLPEKKRILQPGDRVPEVTLVNQDGREIHLQDYRGDLLLLTFIYTRCPLPNYCKLMSRSFQTIHHQLPDSVRSQVQLLSISFDTQYETPATLREYAAQYTDSTERWTFATGSAEQIGLLTSRFGVFYSYDDVQKINHNLVTALVDRTGTIRKIWRGNDWEPAVVMDAIKKLL